MKIFFTIFSLFLVSGCVTNLPTDRNLSAGRELAALIRLFNDKDISGGYPITLDELVSSGMSQALPKCQCEDGKMRDFVYVSRFPTTSPHDYVVLISPPEMHQTMAIAVYLNLEAKLLSQVQATAEVERSRAFIKSTGGNPP